METMAHDLLHPEQILVFEEIEDLDARLEIGCYLDQSEVEGIVARNNSVWGKGKLRLATELRNRVRRPRDLGPGDVARERVVAWSPAKMVRNSASGLVCIRPL